MWSLNQITIFRHCIYLYFTLIFNYKWMVYNYLEMFLKRSFGILLALKVQRKATSTLKPTVHESAWCTEGSQSDYGRKTVLKFAVNAKQISTPLNGWINSTREQAHRSGGQEEGSSGEKRRNTGTGKAVPSKRQLRFVCFQLICLKLHLALRLGRNWEVACRSVECYK